MNILFDINHPAHVHLFRNAIKALESKGHYITITARDKDVTLPLLEAYKIPYISLSKAQKGLLGLGFELLMRQFKLFSILHKNKIRVCVSATGACSVHVCKLLGIPSLVFYDTEHAQLQNALTIPFATSFITPSSFKKRYGENHITYNGVHDLAYLHPKYFTPDADIAKSLGILNDERFVLMRFVSWGAAHDIGQKRMTLEFKKTLIDLCSQYAKVFIVSESPLSPEFEAYRLAVPPEKILDVLNLATVYIGDGGSMATEAAILGTPSVFISSLSAGVFDELEKGYGLMRAFTPDQESQIYATIEELLEEDNAKSSWNDKRKKFLEDKVNVTDFMLETILQYAET